MKIKNLLLVSIALLFANFVFTSCDSDDNKDKIIDENSKIELPKQRVFILNEGSFKQNNASLSFYNKSTKKLIEDIFFTQNESKLGDVGQDMIEYKGSIYISVYGSNFISKLSSAGVEEKRVSFVNDEVLSGGVRYLAAEDGYIYASFYGGVVAKIDANTLEVVAKLENLGSNLEGVAITNDNLYIADSYKMDGTTYNYLNKIIIVDLKNFVYKGNITVATNPNQLLEEDDKLFLISWGNYGSEGYKFQKIEPSKGNLVTDIATATKMAVGNDMVYLVNSVTNWATYTTTNTFSSYDIETGTLNEYSFLKNAPEELTSKSIYMMAVDENSGDIYIGTTLYSKGNGTIYRFNNEGVFIEMFDCGGISPSKMVFFN